MEKVIGLGLGGKKPSRISRRNFSSVFVMPRFTFTAKVLRLAKLLVKGIALIERKAFMAEINPAKKRFLEWDVDNQQPLDCPMCDGSNCFDINPTNPAEGYCHKEETIWTVKPSKGLEEIKAKTHFATMPLESVQRHELFWNYCLALERGEMEGVEECLRYAQHDAMLERQILALHTTLVEGLPQRPTTQAIASQFLERLVKTDDAQSAWKSYNTLWKQKTFYEEIGDVPFLRKLIHVVVDAFFDACRKPSYPIRDAYLTFLLRWLGFTVYEDCPDCKHTISAHGDNGCNMQCSCSRPKYGFFFYLTWDIAKKGTDKTVTTSEKL